MVVDPAQSLLQSCCWFQLVMCLVLQTVNFYFSLFSFTCQQLFAIVNLTICFFLLKNLRYFNVYHTNEVYSIKNHICENLMYLKKNLS
jgi:hypothetical protein